MTKYLNIPEWFDIKKYHIDATYNEFDLLNNLDDRLMLLWGSKRGSDFFYNDFNDTIEDIILNKYDNILPDSIIQNPIRHSSLKEKERLKHDDDVQNIIGSNEPNSLIKDPVISSPSYRDIKFYIHDIDYHNKSGFIKSFNENKPIIKFENAITDEYKALIQIDLLTPDVILVEKFKHHLKIIRKNKHLSFSNLQSKTQDSVLKKFNILVKYKLFAVFDLIYWASINGGKISQEKLGKAIFPELDFSDLDLKDRMRKTILPILDNCFHFRYSENLHWYIVINFNKYIN